MLRMCSWVKVEEQWLCLLDLFSFFLDVNQQQLAEKRSIISAYFEPRCHHFLCVVTIYSLLTLRHYCPVLLLLRRDYWSQDKIGVFHVCTLKWPKHNWWTDSHFQRCAIKGSFIGPRRIHRHSEQLSYTSQTGILLCLVSGPSFIEIEIFIDFYIL